MKATAMANANIAIIKYWGRRDERLNLPANGSISFTMDDQLQSRTTVEFSERYAKDAFWLDGKPARPHETARASAFLDIVRRMAGIRLKAKIVSRNNFPKSAGLASSASGFAALAGAASRAAGLKLGSRGLSMLARRGSGSAARSVLGGAVEWKAGARKDGSDCYAVQLAKPSGWKELRDVIAIFESGEKKVGSQKGMAGTQRTSPCFNCRIKAVDERLKIVRAAIRKRDFGAMAETIMRESDNMHAAMLDSWPPLFYMNDRSRELVERVIALNERCGKNVAAYTFDAGPNGHVYTTAKYAATVRKEIERIGGVKRIIECKVGEGLRFSDSHLF